MVTPTVLTIGHSSHPIDTFLQLIRMHEISAVADVRSAPYSRFNPQYNKQALERALKRCGIAYVFLGKELGARPDREEFYEAGKVVYKRIAVSREFQAGIARVRKGAEKHRIALLCAERNPVKCHRTLLVAPALEAQNLAVVHILADGSTEANAVTVRRLLDLGNLEGNLFDGEEDRSSGAP